MNLPDDRKYTESFLWMEKVDRKIRIGISEPAAEKARKFLYLELPGEGDKIRAGEPLLEYEAMKRVGELESPVTAEVVEVNSEVEQEPLRIVEDPWKNWLVALELPDDFSEEEYLNSEEAEEYYEKEM